MTVEHSGNGALSSSDHDRVIGLEAAVSELRKDVGESSSAGIRGKLDDHIKTCGDRWKELATSLADLRGEIRGMKWMAGGVGFVITCGLVIVGWLLVKR